MDKSDDSRKRNASCILKDVAAYIWHHNHKYAVFAFVVFVVAAAAAASM